MNKIIISLFFSCFYTIIFLFIPNKSNFSTEKVLPLLVSGITKYTIGDWDKNYKWTFLDILYWISIILTSYITIKLFNLFNN